MIEESLQTRASALIDNCPLNLHPNYRLWTEEQAEQYLLSLDSALAELNKLRNELLSANFETDRACATGSPTRKIISRFQRRPTPHLLASPDMASRDEDLQQIESFLNRLGKLRQTVEDYILMMW